MFDWLTTDTPGATLRAMQGTGELRKLLPEVAALYGVPQHAEHHPEVDTGAHIELCLDAAVMLGASPAARFAVLLHDLGKGLTDPATWPAHHSHEKTGVPLVHNVCRRLGIDEYRRNLARLVCGEHLLAHRVFDLRASTVLQLLDENGMLADPGLLEDFILACESDARGRLGRDQVPYPQGQYLREAAQALRVLPDPAQVPWQSAEWQRRHKMRLDAVKTVHKRVKESLPVKAASPD